MLLVLYRQTRSRAVAGNPCDAAVNFDRRGVCRRFQCYLFRLAESTNPFLTREPIKQEQQRVAVGPVGLRNVHCILFARCCYGAVWPAAAAAAAAADVAAYVNFPD